MINRVVLVGRITKDPELRKTQSGISTVRFTLACNRRFSGKDGNQQADFISCVAWRQSADFLANYVKKGALLGVEGSIQTGSYQDQNGRTVYTTDVVCDSVQILEQKRDNQNYQQPMNNYQPNNYQNSYQPNNYQPDPIPSFESEFGADTLDIASDDLPF